MAENWKRHIDQTSKDVLERLSGYNGDKRTFFEVRPCRKWLDEKFNIPQ